MTVNFESNKTGYLEKFIYPLPPSQLDLFAKHRFVKRPNTAAVTYLERMLTKTSLTTQKASHRNIQEFGARLHEQQLEKLQEERNLSIKNAIKRTEEACKKEKELALVEAARAAEQEKQIALEQQRCYFEQIAQRIKENRDKLEQERIQQVINKKAKEKAKALKEQWEYAERLKKEAMERVLKEQHKKLRVEAALERESSIAKALRVAKEHFQQTLEETIETTREECQKIALENETKAKELHKVEVERLRERIAVLTMEAQKHLEKRRHAQKDYVDLEADYSRFLDVTTKPPCHSDFLLSPRKLHHGIGRSKRDRDAQTNMIALEQMSELIQTDVQIMARR